MNNRAINVFVIVFLWLSNVCDSNANTQSDQLTHLTSWDQAVSDAISKNIPIIILVEQRYCGFCQKLKKEVFRPTANNPDYFGRVIFASVLTDFDGPLIERRGEKISGFEFAETFNANTTPTVLFFNSSGDLQQRVVGYFDEANYKDKFINTVETLLSSNTHKGLKKTDLSP